MLCKNWTSSPGWRKTGSSRRQAILFRVCGKDEYDKFLTSVTHCAVETLLRRFFSSHNYLSAMSKPLHMKDAKGAN